MPSAETLALGEETPLKSILVEKVLEGARGLPEAPVAALK